MAKSSRRGSKTQQTPAQSSQQSVESTAGGGALAADGPADYGLDSPARVHAMFGRAGWTLAFAITVYMINRVEYPGPAFRLAGTIALIGVLFLAGGAMLRWSSRTAKLRLRDELLDSLALDGSEKVLDAGCGLGLLAVGAAKRIAERGGDGKVTAVDTWDPARLSGNSQEAARRNARAENVAEKIKFDQGDITNLPYPDSSFEVVLSSLQVHHLPEAEQRKVAVREMLRVLKPGGKLLIHDIFRAPECAATLREAGARDVVLTPTSFLWCAPSRTVTASK